MGRSGVGLAARSSLTQGPAAGRTVQRGPGGAEEGRPRVSGGWGVGRRGPDCGGGNWKESGEASGGEPVGTGCR